ncbi:hypothetical protein FOA52_004277 [Chlamydomonas sp. UWO 241]|nr:hypothetical protein FOA52_004277 [Chlamydomonas sp. UWO 241]
MVRNVGCMGAAPMGAAPMHMWLQTKLKLDSTKRRPCWRGKSNMSGNKCAYSLHGAGASCSPQFAGARRPPHLNGGLLAWRSMTLLLLQSDAGLHPSLSRSATSGTR